MRDQVRALKTFPLKYWRMHLPSLTPLLGDFDDDPIPYIYRQNRTSYRGPDRSYIVRYEQFWPRIEAKRVYLCLFIPDDELEKIWQNLYAWTQRVRRYNPYAVIGVSFSIWQDDPLIIQLYNLWRTRFVERYLQDHGIRIIPTIAPSRLLIPLIMSSLPPFQLPAVCMDIQSYGKGELLLKRVLGAAMNVYIAKYLRTNQILFWGARSYPNRFLYLRHPLAPRSIFVSLGNEYKNLLAAKRTMLPTVPVQRQR